ncbi:ABC-type sugar transport system, periplasmic component [Gottschalkia purinilytica]|uniref:ABC-type sugar transport system, periplasmic component n=1 Tax=Gottschalkia purinilytica TaxID=1503 RepID=A0A0L0WCT6_GOTPU|nr:substrate-binding domain-containing protein [Gottschalkia purinilytica]KNF09271.1 ABC-type sugar transport system, periplasmic component [Gottschalkia purinilytica]
MKRIFAALISIIMLFNVVACTNKDANKEDIKNKETFKESVKQEKTEKNTAFKEAEKKLLDSLQPLPKVSKEYKIAGIEPTLSNPFWVTFKEGYESAAKEYGVKCDVLATPKEDDVNGQLDIFKSVVGKDYDAIVFSAITPFNLIPGVLEANKKNIPVVAAGNNIDDKKGKEAGANVLAHITTDTEKQGEIGAKFIVDKIKKGKVAIIEGISGASQGERRKNGAKKYFESVDGVEIISIQAGDWDRKKSYDIATNIVQANPDIEGIFCANDMMALGVVDALKAMNKKQDVVVVGVDFIDEARESIKSKELDATVAMSPYLYAKGGLILALKALEGQNIDQKVYWTPLEVVNSKNVDSFEGWK